MAPSPVATNDFRAILNGLLDKSTFLPNGGILDYGLAHLYPITFKTVREDLVPYLKSGDAHMYRVCRLLQLNPTLQVNT